MGCNGCGTKENGSYGYVGAYVGWYCSGCKVAAQNAHDDERARCVEIVERLRDEEAPLLLGRQMCDAILREIKGGGEPEAVWPTEKEVDNLAGDPSPIGLWIELRDAVKAYVYVSSRFEPDNVYQARMKRSVDRLLNDGGLPDGKQDQKSKRLSLGEQ